MRCEWCVVCCDVHKSEGDFIICDNRNCDQLHCYESISNLFSFQSHSIVMPPFLFRFGMHQFHRVLISHDHFHL